jgi:competence CoiA-like predicted nuclease
VSRPDVLVPYAAKDSGKLLVARAADVGTCYFCPQCNGPLTLKRSLVRVAHFAHRPSVHDGRCNVCRCAQSEWFPLAAPFRGSVNAEA